MKVKTNTAASTTEKNYLAEAVFITVFIFFPVGILAIKHSLEAKKFYAANQFLEARSSAKTSKRLISISLIIAGTIYALGFLGLLLLVFLK